MQWRLARSPIRKPTVHRSYKSRSIRGKIGGLYQVLGTISPEGTGWTAIQLETLLSGGISGGPTLDSLGNMVGIATFGIVDPEFGGTIPGLHFWHPQT